MPAEEDLAGVYDLLVSDFKGVCEHEHANASTTLPMEQIVRGSLELSVKQKCGKIAKDNGIKLITRGLIWPRNEVCCSYRSNYLEGSLHLGVMTNGKLPCPSEYFITQNCRVESYNRHDFALRGRLGIEVRPASS